MRKKLIIILFTLLILFLGLILAISFFKERKFYDPAIRLVASVKTDSTMCSKIFDKNHKDICYGDVAKKTGNVELCNNVKSYYLKNWCFMYAYVANNDYQSCEKLGDQYQAGCYNYIAISLNNTELCKKVITPKSNQFSADRCIKSIEFNTNNSSYCLDQTQTAKNNCVRIKAIVSNSLNDCEIIKEGGNSHYFECYTEIAAKLNNISICNNYAEKDECLTRVAEKNLNLEGCKNIEDQLRKDSCFKSVAFDNIEVCNLIENEETKSYCYAIVAINIPDKSICEITKNVGYANAKTLCDKNVPRVQKITEKCMRKGTQEEKDICFVALAIDIHRTSPCMKVTDPDINLECVIEVSKPIGL